MTPGQDLRRAAGIAHQREEHVELLEGLVHTGLNAETRDRMEHLPKGEVVLGRIVPAIDAVDRREDRGYRNAWEEMFEGQERRALLRAEDAAEGQCPHRRVVVDDKNGVAGRLKSRDLGDRDVQEDEDRIRRQGQ